MAVIIASWQVSRRVMAHTRQSITFGFLITYWGVSLVPSVAGLPPMRNSPAPTVPAMFGPAILGVVGRLLPARTRRGIRYRSGSDGNAVEWSIMARLGALNSHK